MKLLWSVALRLRTKAHEAKIYEGEGRKKGKHLS